MKMWVTIPLYIEWIDIHLMLILVLSQTTEEVEAAAKRGEPVERAVSGFTCFC